MKHRLFLLLLLIFFGSFAYTQTTIYEIQYNLDKDLFYKALLFRNCDGTGFIRVVAINDPVEITELDLNVYYEGEDPDDSEETDSSILVFEGYGSRLIRGHEGDKDPEGLSPDEYYFKKNEKTGFYEPFKVISPAENEKEADLEGVMTSIRLINDEDLTKDFVKIYFTEQDQFYKNRFTNTVRTVAPQVQQQTTLHLILIANTEDPTIGASSITDRRATKKVFQQVAEVLGIRFNPKEISGEAYNKRNVIQAMNDTRVGPNDIFVFYYSGHGFNNKAINSAFPSMDLRPGSHLSLDNNNTLGVEEVYNYLKEKKGARLNLVISDCCNSEAGLSSTIKGNVASTRPSSIGWNRNNCIDLFLNSRQSILVTAASRGELSGGSPGDGGIFTANFRAQLEKFMGPFYSGVSWGTLIETAKNQAKKEAEGTDCMMPDNTVQKCKQTPVSKVQ